LSISDEIKRDEGLRLHPYLCTSNKLTIGYGRNLEDRGITEAEADYLLANDLISVTTQLRNNLDFFDDLPENVQHALINMAFNMGVLGLLRFRRMLMAMEAADYEAAATEALKSLWARQVGTRADRISKQIRGV